MAAGPGATGPIAAGAAIVAAGRAGGAFGVAGGGWWLWWGGSRGRGGLGLGRLGRRPGRSRLDSAGAFLATDDEVDDRAEPGEEQDDDPPHQTAVAPHPTTRAAQVPECPDRQAELEQDERSDEDDQPRIDPGHRRSPTLSLAGSDFQTWYE